MGRSDIVETSELDVTAEKLYHHDLPQFYFKRGSLEEHVRRAEILVVAWAAQSIKNESRGAVVIDVGMNAVGDRLVGDVEFEEARKRAAYITPVPGGTVQLRWLLSCRIWYGLPKCRPGLSRREW